ERRAGLLYLRDEAFLCERVLMTRGLIEDEHRTGKATWCPRGAQQGPREGEALAFAPAQRTSPPADGSIERQRRAGRAEGVLQVVFGGVGGRHEQVLFDRGVEQERFLVRDGHDALHLGGAEAAHVHVPEEDRAGARVAMALEQPCDRRLPRPGGP